MFGLIRKRLKRTRKLPLWCILLYYSVTRLLLLTLRIRLIDPNNFFGTPGRQCVFVSWHNRIVLLPVALPKSVVKSCSTLTSRSRDGQYIGDYLTFLGIKTVCGSSSKGGVKALWSLSQDMVDGQHVLLTPDGPRGPKYGVKEGALWLASKHQCPIVPLSFNSKSRWTLKTWDKTQIPRPFSRVEFVVGDPIFLPKDLDEESIATYTEEVRTAMIAITDDCDTTSQ